MSQAKYISAYNYFGGKNNRKLLSFILKKLNLQPVYHLAEVFAGSAAVSLNFPQAKIRTINDLNNDIYNFFYQLRSNPDELLRALEFTPYSRTEYENHYMALAMDPVERARVFFLRTCQSFGNTGALRKYNSWSYTIRDIRYGCSQSTARYLSKVKGLPEVINELRYMQVDNDDFRKFIARYDSEETTFYVDPPYVHRTRTNHIKYRFEMTDEDHHDLSTILKSIKGRFLISGYNNDLYASLYSDCCTAIAVCQALAVLKQIARVQAVSKWRRYGQTMIYTVMNYNLNKQP